MSIRMLLLAGKRGASVQPVIENMWVALRGTWRWAGVHMVIWGAAMAFRAAVESGAGTLAAQDSLWTLNAKLAWYWIGLILCVAGLMLSLRLGSWWRAVGVVIIAMVARDLPLFVTWLPYGWDAYGHWSSAQLIYRSGAVALDAPAHTYLSLPLLFSWGGMLMHLSGAHAIEQALPVLIGWQLLMPAMTALFGLMLAARLTSDPVLQTSGALAIAAASPFFIPTHFSPLSIAGPLIWALFWLAALPRSFGRALAQIAVVTGLIVLHPLLPLLYFGLAGSIWAIERVQSRPTQGRIHSPLALTLVCYLTWQIYVAASYSLPIGIHLIQVIIANLWSMSAAESAQQNFSGGTPQIVSLIRWSIFISGLCLAAIAALYDLKRQHRLPPFAGAVALAAVAAGIAGFSGKYGEFAARALPFVVPLALLTVLSASPPAALRTLVPAWVTIAVMLTVVAGHYDAPMRVSLPEELEGLRYAGGLVTADDTVLVEPALRVFRDEQIGHYQYETSRRYLPGQLRQSTMVVIQQVTRANMRGDTLALFEQTLSILENSWNTVYDNGRVQIYRRAEMGYP
jgi:hypothetical protein